MKTKSIIMAVSLVLVGLFVFGLFVPMSAVQASDDQNPLAEKTPGPLRATLVPVRETLAALPTPDPIALENLLKREQLTLSNQQTRLELSHTVADATQDYIDSQKSEGKDTTALENALSKLNQSITDAEKFHAEAAGVLASPAGFDADGHVTDRATANQTLRAAGQSLRQAHLVITSGTLDLRQAMKAYLGK